MCTVLTKVVNIHAHMCAHIHRHTGIHAHMCTSYSTVVLYIEIMKVWGFWPKIITPKPA